MKLFPLVTVTIQLNALRNNTSLNILSITLQGNAGVPGKNGDAGEMVCETLYTFSGEEWRSTIFFVINEILGPFWPANEFIRNRAFVVRFGVISGEFSQAMLGILARRSLDKIPIWREQTSLKCLRSVPRGYY